MLKKNNTKIIMCLSIILSLFLCGCDGSTSTSNSPSNPLVFPPYLNKLQVKDITEKSFLLVKPTLNISTVDSNVTMTAYIGLSDEIDINGTKVTNYIGNPVNVTNTDYSFEELKDMTSYKVIVVATNSAGFDVEEIIVSTKKFRINTWVRISGNYEKNKAGIYGTKGVADSENIPGARYEAISWQDEDGNFWLFGGQGYDSKGISGYLNDLWKYDGTNWIWISGSNECNQDGIYGTKGVADDSSYPGGRHAAGYRLDKAGNLWLFGGHGRGLDSQGYLNDLWKFDGVHWIWISGADTAQQVGVYGDQGIADLANIPGSRFYPVLWIDKDDNIFIFGGMIYCGGGSYRYQNDLWKFDGENWTWVAGGYDTIVAPSNYGEKGVPASTNYPGGRIEAASCIDNDGNLYLFGGSSPKGESLGDLWKFDGEFWTWIAGTNNADEKGSYGIQEVPALSNYPGTRTQAQCWFGGNDIIYIFGGNDGGSGYFCDTWEYDGNYWTWLSGLKNGVKRNSVDDFIEYFNNAQFPVGRHAAAIWSDEEGNMWLFGGEGCDQDESDTIGYEFFNDFWKYTP